MKAKRLSDPERRSFDHTTGRPGRRSDDIRAYEAYEANRAAETIGETIEGVLEEFRSCRFEILKLQLEETRRLEQALSGRAGTIEALEEIKATLERDIADALGEIERLVTLNRKVTSERDSAVARYAAAEAELATLRDLVPAGKRAAVGLS